MVLMHSMYSNLAKGQAFPLVTKLSSKPIFLKQFYSLKFQPLPIGFYPKPLLHPKCVQFATLSHGFDHKLHKVCDFMLPTKNCAGFQLKSMEMGGHVTRGRSITSGFRIRSVVHCRSILRARNFSSLYSHGVGEGNHEGRVGKALPWLRNHKFKESKGLEKGASAKKSRSWQESVKTSEKVSSISSWEESAKGVEKVTVIKAGRSSWEESAGVRNRLVSVVNDRENGYSYNERNDLVEEEDKGEEQLEAVDDPRWDKIKNKVRGMGDVKDRADKPEYQRWNKQENWGKKIWKEATESTLPKMVGEGVYGVGPVLAALSAKRREFYALYVQVGLDLSGNNKKKKDKKGFEKVLRMAQKIGLSITEVSKHDLNMIVDNRPHQGLVLDASPLEMVKINELDPVVPEEDKGSLWVALDEVTDPQNLGAIIRSAYFFGASGVVLCAKNSAPLSGVVSKASAGSLELMELMYCKNMMQFLVSSADNGWRVVGGSVSSKAVPLNEVSPGEPTILVLGSEGTGLRPLVERSCTQLIRIPGNIPVNITAGGGDDVEAKETSLVCSTDEFRSFLAVESLNVSVAAGVLLHHFVGNNCNDKSTDVVE